MTVVCQVKAKNIFKYLCKHHLLAHPHPSPDFNIDQVYLF